MKHNLTEKIFHNVNQYSFELLLEEEMKSEGRIAIIRLVSLVLLFISASIESLIFHANVISYIYPFSGGIVLSIFFLAEIKYLIKHKEKFRKLQKVYKYLVITADTVVLMTAILHVFKILNSSGEIREIAATYFPVNSQTFLLMLFLAAMAIIVINLFRFSHISTVYAGSITALSTIIFYTYFTTGSPFLIGHFFRERINIMFIMNIIFLTTLTFFISAYFRGVVLRSRRQEQLTRFLPKEVAKEVLTGETNLAPGGRRKEVTILFSDIRNFTSLAEKNPAEDVVDFLNSYLNQMIEIIFRNQGSLDKIIGDGIMAIYGMTDDTDNGVRQAVTTARDMMDELEIFNRRRESTGLPKIEIGIGIHTGDVILGYIGSNRRMDFTAIGDTVNTAARLESFSKTVDASIIFSEAVVEQLEGKIPCKQLGEATLKGKEQSVMAYTLA